jgi:CxxC motif-containing protein (DUF1111 family)
MKRLKISILLLFVAVALTANTFHWTTNSKTSRHATGAQTSGATTAAGATSATDGDAVGADQANRASNTGVDVTESRAIDTEGSNPDSDANFSFDADKDPAAAGGTSASTKELGSASKSGTARSAGPQGGGIDAACWIPITNAPADFDNQSNTYLSQNDFDDFKKDFDKVDEITPDGLGPVYNAQSCRECHQNPVSGAISQINELRAGHTKKVTNNQGQVVTIFVDAPGGSLINDRSIPTHNSITPPSFGAKTQERVPPLLTAGIIGGGGPITKDEPVRTFRISLNTLGDGFLEAVPNGTLLAISTFQSIITGGVVHGQAIAVPVLEANINTNPDCANPLAQCIRRIGRFGWKDQHASLLSFSGDAYRNEIGITNFLIREENTSLGRFIGFGSGFDPVPDNLTPNAEDAAGDIFNFASFMRSTKAPPRDPDITSAYGTAVAHGRQLFSKLSVPGYSETYSCSICHVPTMLTAPPCTVINGGQFTVPAALGNKIIRPFSDGLLHDIGTGDGIVQNGPQEDTVPAQWSTRNKIRTPPLWGVRTHDRLLHDGSALTFRDAILKHKNEAISVTNRFQLLSTADQNDLITFLESL